MIGIFPFLAHMTENAFALGATLPIGDDFTLIGVNVLLRDEVRLQFAIVQCVEILDAVAGEFREGRNSFGQRTALTHNQFVRSDIDGLLLTKFIEVAGTQNAGGHLAVVLLVERCLAECTLYGEGGGGVDALLVQTLHAIVHATLILRVLERVIHFAVRLAHSDSRCHIVPFH